MPQLEQPPSLLNMATDVLVDMFATNCHKCSSEGSLDKLRRYVAFIKEDIGPRIPWHLTAGIYEMFLKHFLHDYKPLAEIPRKCQKAVFEVLMDRKLYRLKCSYLQFMDIKDAHRIEGLLELKLFIPYYNLESFRLENLRALEYFNFCTDSNLKVIGRNCPKLGFLNIQSAEITDDGLLALCSCSDSRDLFVNLCRKLTYKGIRDFLSTHGKIQRFQARFCGRGADFKGIANVGWSVYPSVTELAITEYMDDKDLRCITEKFPKLISLCISAQFHDSADLCTLASLNKLSALQLFHQNFFIWDNVKDLLRLIGANITNLDVECGYISCQSNLDFLYEFCPNIERMNFYYLSEGDEEIMAIPPFKRLRKLGIVVNHVHAPRLVALQFGIMPELEKIRLCRFRITTETVESIILDNTKFPNLMSMRLTHAPADCNIDRIRKIIKNKNLRVVIDAEISVYTYLELNDSNILLLYTEIVIDGLQVCEEQISINCNRCTKKGQLV